VREVRPGSEPALEAAMGEEGDRVRLRLERGCRCFAAWRDDRLLAYGWVSTGPEWIGELQLEISPGRGQGYVWNCVTLAPHRRQGIFRALLVAIAAQLRSEGLARLWIGSEEDPAEKAVADAGFRQVLSFARLSPPGLIWLRAAPAAGADPSLVSAALQAVAARPGSSLRRARKRRH